MINIVYRLKYPKFFEESIDNIEVAYALAKKYEVEMPIVNTVYDVLYNNLDPKEAVQILMSRDKKMED